MIAVRDSAQKAIATKEMEKMKATPRTVDEFLAELNKKDKKK